MSRPALSLAQPDICTLAAEAGVPEVVVEMLSQHAAKADVCRQCCLVVRRRPREGRRPGYTKPTLVWYTCDHHELVWSRLVPSRHGTASFCERQRACRFRGRVPPWVPWAARLCLPRGS
jgi:hypothetical protein